MRNWYLQDTFNDIELDKPQKLEIRYISTGGSIINPSAFNTPIKSHTYDKNTHEGVITFSSMFISNKNSETLFIPSSY